MKRPLVEASGLSERARRILTSAYFDRLVARRSAEGSPYSLSAVLNRAVSIDWSLLDLFYRICGFRHFRAMFDLAETGRDEGPICNLGLISQYLTRFMDDYVYVLTAYNFQDNRLTNRFFGSFLFALYRLGESEYENVDDPFPRGRIPFLTIHQSKGLEFPVVVLPNPRKNINQPSIIEKTVRPFFQRDEGEPLDRMSQFDVMRMFYVALSRAENLLVLGHLQAKGQYVSPPFREMLNAGVPRIHQLDLDTVPSAGIEDDPLPRPYSYTADFQAYKKCPRQYMVFRKYGFAASRSQTMFFGSLVHQTLEDLHNHLIAQRTVAV